MGDMIRVAFQDTDIFTFAFWGDDLKTGITGRTRDPRKYLLRLVSGVRPEKTCTKASFRLWTSGVHVKMTRCGI